MVSFAKVALDVGTDTGSIDMRGVGTAMVREEGAQIPFPKGAEVALVAVCEVVRGGC